MPNPLRHKLHQFFQPENALLHIVLAAITGTGAAAVVLLSDWWDVWRTSTLEPIAPKLLANTAALLLWGLILTWGAWGLYVRGLRKRIFPRRLRKQGLQVLQEIAKADQGGVRQAYCSQSSIRSKFGTTESMICCLVDCLESHQLVSGDAFQNEIGEWDSWLHLTSEGRKYAAEHGLI